MAKTKISGKIARAKRKLEVTSAELEKAIRAETESILDPSKAKAREAEIRNLFFTARKKTKGFQTGILRGLFGEDVGQTLANIFAKEDPKKIKSAQKFFLKYKKPIANKNALKNKQLKDMGKIMGAKRMPMGEDISSPITPENIQLKEGFYYDPRIGAKGGIRNVRTGKLASKEEAMAKRKETTDRLTKAIGADEEPLVLLREKFDILLKNVGKDTAGKTIHEKLDELLGGIENGPGPGLGLFDLFGGRRGGRRGGRTVASTKKTPLRDSKGRFTKAPDASSSKFGAGKLLAGGLGAVAGGYLGYKAVDVFRDEDLTSYDPEVLKQEAIAAREAGDTEYTEALKTQISMQKKDVALQAGSLAAGVAGAGAGAYASTKVVQKVAQAAPVKKVATVVKNKTWDLFVKFLQKRAPKLATKLGARLAAAGAMATIPLAGWVGAAISLGFAAWTAYDMWLLWREFSALSDAEKEAAASGTGPTTKAVRNWAYSVYIGKATLDQVPKEYLEEVEEILKNPPSNWTKAKESASIGKTTSQETAVPPSPEKMITEVPPPAAVKPTSPQEAGMFSKAASAVKSAAISTTDTIKSFFGMEPEDPMNANLNQYVKLKDSSVNLEGLKPEMKKRLAGLAYEYNQKTGEKIQINSGYRSSEEQAELFAKYGAPRAAPPGRSRHESGLAIDINSSDANKAIELGLMAKYGFTRPVRGETWHIEPVETAKRGGTPDNPYKPGDPIVAANDGKEVNPESGTKPSGAIIADRLPDSGVAPAGGLGPAGQPRGPGMQIADRLPDSGVAPVGGLGPAGQPRGSGMQIGDRLPDSGITPASPGLGPAGQPRGPGMQIGDRGISPVASSLGTVATKESMNYEKNKVDLQATPPPVVINNNGSSSQQPITPPKQDLPKASSRMSDNSFNRAISKDFSHPTAFTSVGVI